MNRHLLLTTILLILTVFLVTSCGTAPPAEPTPTPSAVPDQSESEPALSPAEQADPEDAIPTVAAIPTAAPLPENYPPPQEESEQPALDVGYPGPPTAMPVDDSYPGDMIWIVRPIGVQCEEGTAPGYGDLNEAVATVTAAGITVSDSEMIEMAVATICGAATSTHYRLQIQPEDLGLAMSLGWEKGSS
ncbi:MAG: hypothetical protein JSV68_14070 [Anaerolineaceae bacterium]|nr:MAG: hypothetical protein JSV68_14070 [Anaerolineaceae bacterium]